MAPITNSAAGQARLAAVTLYKALLAIDEAANDLDRKGMPILRERAIRDIRRWCKAAIEHVASQPTDADPLTALRQSLDAHKLAYVREDGAAQTEIHNNAKRRCEAAINAMEAANRAVPKE